MEGRSAAQGWGREVKKTFVIVAIILAVGMLAAIFFRREPSADGRTLTEWLRLGWPRWSDGVEGFDSENREITNAVRKIGAAAVPTLLAKLRAEDLPWKKKLDNKWGRMILPEREDAYRQRGQAVYGFSILGTQAISALPELYQMCLLTNADAPAAGFAMGCLGPEALPFLKAAWTNENIEVQMRAISGMVATREMARLNFAEILALRNEANRGLALRAVSGAMRVLPEAESLLIATNFLQIDDFKIQVLTLIRTGRFCTNSAGAIPFVVPFLTNANATLRREATNALLKFDPKQTAAQGDSSLLQH